MRNLLWILVISALLYSVAHEGQAQSNPSWGAWFYDQQNDTLYLVTEQGEETSLARPHLPQEQGLADVEMSVSRDGRYLILAAERTDGAQGMGIYNVEMGQFVQTYVATIGDDIVLGSSYIFDPLSRRVAVGFWNEPNSAWVVIVYDLMSGDVIDQIGWTSPLVTDTLGAEPPGIIPQVLLFDGDVIHFTLSESGTGDIVALDWNIAVNSAEAGSFAFPPPPQSDFLVQSSTQPLFLTSVSGRNNFDAVASGTASSPTILWSDDTQNYVQARWAGDGQLVAMASTDPSGKLSWQIFDILQGGTPTALDTSIRDVYGISGGFLSINIAGEVNQHETVTPTTSTLIWTAPNSDIDVVWVTPLGGALLVTNVPDTTTTPITPPSTTTSLCAGSPESRMELNIQGRIISDFTPTRLRSYPSTGAEQIGEMVDGERFDVLAGPRCADGFVWWAVRTNEGRMGWAAEGTINDGELNYFMSPIAGSSAAYTFDPNAVVNSTELNVRADPGLGGELLLTTEHGVELMVLGRIRSSTWVLVTNGDGSIAGWVATELLQADSSLLRAPVIDVPILPSRN